MSEISTGFGFFLAAEVQIAQLHAYGRMQKMHSDVDGPVRRQGTCTTRKRPESTKRAGHGPWGCLHFGGSREVLFVHRGVCTCLKTGRLFDRWVLWPSRRCRKTLTALMQTALTPCPSPVLPTMSTCCPTAGGRGEQYALGHDAGMVDQQSNAPSPCPAPAYGRGEQDALPSPSGRGDIAWIASEGKESRRTGIASIDGSWVQSARTERSLDETLRRGSVVQHGF
jgi:hypothetical protein